MKRSTLRVLVLLATCAGAVSAWAQGSAEPGADIRATYDFEPSAMTFEEQARRAPELSRLWGRLDGNRDAYLLALRAELRAEGRRELLYCDGGMLLLAKSTDAEDQQLGLGAIGKCSLAEIQHTPYFYTLHRLAMRGVDTFELQVRMLSRPDYSAFIVQHALTLGQDYAFLYPFLVQQESAYVPRLVALLVGVNDATAQKSIIRALWYAATHDSEAAVRAAAGDRRLADSARADARHLLQGLATVRGWPGDHATLRRIRRAIDVSPGITEEELRLRRRARMRSVSDEALHDLEAYTALIYRLRQGS